ncbi:MAG: hypothetical protein ABL883_02160 [Terricaulis sp.]
MTKSCLRAGVSALSYFAVALSGVASAHHASGPGNSSAAGPINTLSAAPLEEGDFVAGIVVDQNNFDALSDETLAEAAESAASAGDPEAHVHSLDGIRTSALSLAYGLSNDLTVTARLPYVAREDVREGHAHEESPGVFHGEAHALGDSEGWGDLSIIAQWRFFNDEASHTQMAALFGVEAPTGETKVTNAEEERFDAEFQPGSDSWDYFLGFVASRGAGRWGFDASGLYTLTGDGLGANLGDRFNYGLAASYRAFGAPAHNDEGGAPHRHGPALDLVLELSGEWHGKQQDAGVSEPDSGGHVLHVAPGLRYTLNEFSALVSIGAPVISAFNGLQAEPDLRATLGAGYRF